MMVIFYVETLQFHWRNFLFETYYLDPVMIRCASQLITHNSLLCVNTTSQKQLSLLAGQLAQI